MNRKDFLNALKVASLGLSKTGLEEQSDHFIIRKGKIIAYNNEICVRVVVPEIGDFEGAVPGQLLLKAVQGFPDKEITLHSKADPMQLVIKGAAKTADVGVHCKEVKLTVSDVPKSGDRFKLPDWFSDVVVEASRCCNNDHLSGVSTCVHIGPKVIESCDNTRLFYRNDKTGFPTSFFMHCSAANQLSGLELNEASISGGWCHFFIDGGMISIRGREFDKFPDLESILKFEGSTIKLPASLSDSASRCSLMSDGDANVSLVKISIEDQVVKVSAKGVSGWYREKVPLDEGQKLKAPVVFSINPISLSQVLKHQEPVTLSTERMKVGISGGHYCCVLQRVDSE